jgi:hypothetical protein
MKLIDKIQTKKFGLSLIILGAFIPSILYPFTSLTGNATVKLIIFAQNGLSYDTSLKDLEVVFKKGEREKDSKNNTGQYQGRLALPYKYIIAFGILIIFIGISFVGFCKNKL